MAGTVSDEKESETLQAAQGGVGPPDRKTHEELQRIS